jgi:hypothetical protein
MTAARVAAAVLLLHGTSLEFGYSAASGVRGFGNAGLQACAGELSSPLASTGDWPFSRITSPRRRTVSRASTPGFHACAPDLVFAGAAGRGVGLRPTQAHPEAVFHHSANSNARRGPALSLRKRLHVNPLITEPDTIDLEWGAAFSMSGARTFPFAIRYTPQGRSILWGRTEFSASFDSLTYDGGVRHFSDRASFAATTVLHDGARLDIAVAPQVSVLLRGDSGIRYGGTGIARYDAGRHSGGVTLSWTGATTSSPTNPAATFDIGAGYGYALGKISPHVNCIWERSTGTERQISAFEGVEYQITDPFAVDFTVQQINLAGGQRDTQFVLGITFSTPHLHHR